MKPRENKPEIVYRIIERKTGEAVGSYSRACCDEYDFDSVYRARTANCHGKFRDEKEYRIAKYKVTYELVEEDCQLTKEEKDSIESAFGKAYEFDNSTLKSDDDIIWEIAKL